MTSIVEMVRHYQRSIEKSLENPSRLIHCVEKLNKLPITVEHLQETGVGRTVNNLRKYDGEVGYASKALVSKWKTMVATEEAENDSPEEEVGHEEEMQEECHEDNDEDEQDDEGDNQLQIDETENIEPVAESSDDYQQHEQTELKHENHHKSSKHKSSSDKKHKSDKKHSHKDRDRYSSSGMHHRESSSSRKEKDSNKDQTKRHKDTPDETRKEEKSKSTSSETKSLTKHHSSSSSSNKDSSHTKGDSYSSNKRSKEPSGTDVNSPKDNGSHEERRRSNKRHESKKSSKKDKDEKDGKKRKRDTSDIVIDSTMGASFADALGMLDMPSSKSKKHLTERASTSQIPSTSSSTTTSSSSNNSNSTKKSSFSITPTKKLMTEPELLTKRPKFEPMLDIIADIPAPTFTISNNYKPMPLNQTVMDCVFNQSSKPIKQMTDEEALTYSISSNKTRTKVFSGAKSGSKGKVETLFELCIRLLQDHIDYLEYTGGVPFDILRPVLERATYEQLMSLEDYNPYLIEDSDCLWEQHCKRRFRGKRPQEMESWREMFFRCLDEEQAKFKNLTENIKLARDKKLPVRKTKLAYVDSAVKPPRGVKSKQMRYGTDTLPNVTPASRVESLKNVGGNNASIGDRRLKIAAELRNSIPTRKRSKSYEDDPDWTPSTWYRTLHKKPKKDPKQPVVKKSIDMIRYDRARAEAKRKEEERRRNSRKIRSESAPD